MSMLGTINDMTALIRTPITLAKSIFTYVGILLKKVPQLSQTQKWLTGYY